MWSARLVATALLAFAVSFGGCDADGTDGQKSANQPGSGGMSTPPVCTSSGAQDVISRFLGSEETDGNALVAAFVAPEPEFEWFSTRDRLGMEVAADRPSLAQYLTDRRRHGVRQHLTEFDFNGIDGEHANFSFVLDEGVGETILTYWGKGAVHCESGKIIVWSEGTPPQ